MQSLAIDELNSIHISLALLACKNKVNLHPVVMWPLWIFLYQVFTKNTHEKNNGETTTT
jgi:hypothetical protein